jgi:ABC-type Na+ efflux pump permease subunit
MWQKIVDIAKTASSMLHSGDIPPNTPPEYQSDLSKVNFLASKKFFVVFCSVIILSVFYAVSIFVLFLTSTMSTTITSAFVTIFVETIKILAVIIGSYLGVQTLLDFKYKSDSNTEFKSENITEKIEELTVITSNSKEDDYELR